MTTTSAPRYEQMVPDVLKALADVQVAIDTHGIEPGLHHLVVLRASQINHCAFCVKMHTREAREDGESSERLDRLIVWDQVNDFTAREKAALAWTEALTVLDHKTDLAALRGELRAHFSEEEMATLSSLIAMINLWNRIGVSRH